MADWSARYMCWRVFDIVGTASYMAPKQTMGRRLGSAPLGDALAPLGMDMLIRPNPKSDAPARLMERAVSSKYEIERSGHCGRPVRGFREGSDVSFDEGHLGEFCRWAATHRL